MELRDQRHRRQSRDGQRRASGEASEFQIRGSKGRQPMDGPPRLARRARLTRGSSVLNEFQKNLKKSIDTLLRIR
jgi:hypothetical protein